MELNKNIYNLRKTKGFSQEDLAEKVNVSRQTISNWELGETSPNPEQLLLLSQTLETSVDDLLGNEVKIKKDDKHNQIFLGSTLIGGCVASIWSFSSNQFNWYEMVIYIIEGIAIGYGIGLIVNGIVKKLECKNNSNYNL